MKGIVLGLVLLAGCAGDRDRFKPMQMQADERYVCDIITGSRIYRCINVDHPSTPYPLKIYTRDDLERGIVIRR